MSIKISPEIQEFWNEFCQSSNKYHKLQKFKFEAWSFGNTKEMADDLGALVIEGKKTATCSLANAYAGEEDEIPRVGVYSVLCNGDEKPICIIYLTHTWVCKYSDVDERHAYEEGEGDRSLDYWKEAHYEFFSQYKGFSESDELICERFEVVFKK
jgi:uncharacterized protein YhfF